MLREALVSMDEGTEVGTVDEVVDMALADEGDVGVCWVLLDKVTNNGGDMKKWLQEEEEDEGKEW